MAQILATGSPWRPLPPDVKNPESGSGSRKSGFSGRFFFFFVFYGLSLTLGSISESRNPDLDPKNPDPDPENPDFLDFFFLLLRGSLDLRVDP